MKRNTPTLRMVVLACLPSVFALQSCSGPSSTGPGANALLALLGTGGGPAASSSPGPGAGCSASGEPALYSSGSGWNCYVANDAADVFHATGATCNPATIQPGYSSCIHAGEIRSFTLTGETSCAGLSGSDGLDAFDWTCIESTPYVQMVSTGLKSGKHLSDLIDFDAVVWKPNSLSVTGGSFGATSPSVWWNNPIALANSGGSLGKTGTVYIVTSNPSAHIGLDADRVALVVRPGVTVSGGTGTELVNAAKDFLWIEGNFVGTGYYQSLYFLGSRFSVARNVKTGGAVGSSLSSGVYLSGSNNNLLQDIEISNPSTNFGIFLASASDNNTVVGLTTIGVGTAVEVDGNGNTLFNIASTAAGNGIVVKGSKNTIDGFNYVASSYSNITGLSFAPTSSDNLAQNLKLDHGIGVGIGGLKILGSNRNTVKNLISLGLPVYMTSATDALLMNIRVSGFGGLNGEAINLSGGARNRLVNVAVAQSIYGLLIYGDLKGTVIQNLTATNSQYGLHITGKNLTIQNAVAANNEYNYYIGDRAANVLLMNISSSNAYMQGFYLTGSSSSISASSNRISNLAATNATVNLDGYSASNTIENLSTDAGVNLTSTSNNTFAGFLKVSNGSLCVVSGGSNPGLVSGTCANNGSSTAALTTGISLTSSFKGKVNSDDAANGVDSSGQAAYSSIALIDWITFENQNRGWGKDGSAFPNLDHRGKCGTGMTCRIWDWRLSALDSTLRSVLPVPTGNDTMTHSWSDGSSTTFLRNAVEILGDSVGDDDGLCESNEACIYTPNGGGYQGHGSLVSQAFSNGTIMGVTLRKYASNGL